MGSLDRALRANTRRLLSRCGYRDRPTGCPDGERGIVPGGNGAEVVYRASYPHPHTGNEFFEIQNRARALDNNFYVLRRTWRPTISTRARTCRSTLLAGAR